MKFYARACRRRIGKTLLAKKHAEDKDHLYLFTSKKAEKLICDEFLIEYEDFINERYQHPWVSGLPGPSGLYSLYSLYNCMSNTGGFMPGLRQNGGKIHLHER